MAHGDITRSGFRFASGHFYAQGQVERIDGSHLKAMFLPRLTPDANELLQKHRSSFVRAQLQHYGVDYDKNDLSGNGTLLLKKVLKAGKCDRVPDQIEKLRAEMYTEWLESTSDDQISDRPDWIMDKYFVDGSGKPDPTKTTEVVGIPYSRSSDRRISQLREALGRVSGLHQATGSGVSTQTIYLGWDQRAVKKAAKDHGSKEARARQAKGNAREEQRTLKHERYLANSRTMIPSPVGQYIVDCKEIEQGYEVTDLTLAIRATRTSGLYQASFDFGIIEGIMMLSADESMLAPYAEKYGDDSDIEDDYGEDEDEDEEEDENLARGSTKRKATAKPAGGRPLKKAKTGKPRIYFVRLKSRDTGTGEINTEANEGKITFNAPTLSGFTGEAKIGCIGLNVIFTARKVSAVAPDSWDSWDNYSEAAYEYARVSRW